MAKAKQTIFNNPMYQEYINNAFDDFYWYKGKLHKIDNINRINVVIKYTLTQNSNVAMKFNTDFQGIQKNRNGNLYISQESIHRKAFGLNDLTNNANVDYLLDRLIMLRGGIKTAKKVKNEKDGNGSLKCVLNTSVETKKMPTILNNDRSGVKAKEDEIEGYLCAEQLYSKAVFHGETRINIYQFLRNIWGMDFAQQNALKTISATDEEVEEFIENGIFMRYVEEDEGYILDLDQLIETVQNKLLLLEHFSHGSKQASFVVEFAEPKVATSNKDL